MTSKSSSKGMIVTKNDYNGNIDFDAIKTTLIIIPYANLFPNDGPIQFTPLDPN